MTSLVGKVARLKSSAILVISPQILIFFLNTEVQGFLKIKKNKIDSSYFFPPSEGKSLIFHKTRGICKYSRLNQNFHLSSSHSRNCHYQNCYCYCSITAEITTEITIEKSCFHNKILLLNTQKIPSLLFLHWILDFPTLDYICSMH